MKDRRDGHWIVAEKPRWPWARRNIVEAQARPYRLDTAEWERMP